MAGVFSCSYSDNFLILGLSWACLFGGEVCHSCKSKEEGHLDCFRTAREYLKQIRQCDAWEGGCGLELYVKC